MRAFLDDQYHSHPKILAAGNAGAGVYSRTLSYCSAYYTNGFIGAAQAKAFGTPKELAAVTAAGLWIEVAESETFIISGRKDTGNRKREDKTFTAPCDGYFIKDFLVHNPTREEYVALVEGKKDAGGKGGRASRAQAGAQANAQAPAQADGQADLDLDLGPENPAQDKPARTSLGQGSADAGAAQSQRETNGTRRRDD
jgi:hypothetical protein